VTLFVERRAYAPLNGELLRRVFAGRRENGRAAPNKPLEP